jgi:HTH-type transcriptional regulator/antitoxin HipB
MRVSSSRDLGLYLRERRRDLGMTQADLAAAAGVSRRWLSDLEAGKATAEFGLILRTVHALGLVLEVRPAEPSPVNLDALIRDLAQRP